MIFPPQSVVPILANRLRLGRRLSFMLVLFLCCSGCETMQWLAPHQLWKLNRQAPLGTDEAYFSIPAQRTGGNSNSVDGRSR
jgi:hypothetical protein